MTLKEQGQQIKRLQGRVIELVEDLRSTQADIKFFKEAVARDIQRTIDLVKEKN